MPGTCVEGTVTINTLPAATAVATTDNVVLVQLGEAQPKLTPVSSIVSQANIQAALGYSPLSADSVIDCGSY